MLAEWIAVALGGMLGATARHGLYWLIGLFNPGWLPAATLIANVAGCFLIGLLVQWSFQAETTTKWYVVGLRVGFLGGLTTFSAFALDLIRLWYENRSLATLTLAAGHLVFGLTAVLLGMSCVRDDATGEEKV